MRFYISFTRSNIFEAFIKAFIIRIAIIVGLLTSLVALIALVFWLFASDLLACLNIINYIARINKVKAF